MSSIDSFNGISSFLIKECAIDPEVIAKAKAKLHIAKQDLVTYLNEKKLLDEVEFAHRASKFYALPLIDIKALNPNAIPDQYLDEHLIKRYQVIPIFRRDKVLTVASAKPMNLEAIQSYRFLSGLDVVCVMAVSSELSQFITQVTQFYARQTVTSQSLEGIQLSAHEIDQLSLKIDENQNDNSLIEFVNQIILSAIQKGASDIHFEPFERHYRIRYRLDGILYEQSTPPVTLAKRLTSRLKVMANLDIAERRIPQDGRFKMQVSKRNSVDFRISTCPTLYGEKVVLRILDTSYLNLSIDELGLDLNQKSKYLEALSLSQGMILVTGPTGSGKTVTLYSGLNVINRIDKNISTVEDPIEINLPGVNQVNVNPKIGLTFANILRAFLRQDPDILMVGEIRDLETAEIAIRASQTGHLVLSTLHTNSACETITRLISMGVASYHISSSITLVIAQRLVRKLCNYCKEKDHIESQALIELGFSKKQLNDELVIYKACGCNRCNYGYKGREGIFEVLAITPEIQNLILKKASIQELLEEAKNQGMLTLKDAVISKVLCGVTSLEELNRIA